MAFPPFLRIFVAVWVARGCWVATAPRELPLGPTRDPPRANEGTGAPTSRDKTKASRKKRREKYLKYIGENMYNYMNLKLNLSVINFIFWILSTRG
jgi:hypothetical protein